MTGVMSFGRDDVSGRELYSLHLETADGLSQLNLSSPKFVAFLAWDSSHATIEAISQVAEKLLNSGCVYLCAWGNGCERVHDIMDVVLVGPDPSDDVAPVMTTWHQDDSLDEALWFFLNSTWPDDQYFDDCRSAIAITVGGSREFQDRIAFALTYPREFSGQVLSREEDAT